MANIAINNYCNAKCPYCYIDNLKSCQMKTMPIEDFSSLLGWLSNTEEENIGITGGEPTLHPNFDLILKEIDKYCRSMDTASILYTNGSNLKDYLYYVTDNILIVLNWVEDMDQEEIISLLDQQGFFTEDQGILKCSLYIGQKRYRAFWETVRKYKMKKIQACITMPFQEYSKYHYDKEKYFLLMKPIFLQFCKDAINCGTIITVDCPHIPACYFTKEEQEIISEACDSDLMNLDYCLPVIDILPDLTASFCFCANDKPIDLRPFFSIAQLERYFLFKQNLPRIEGNCLGRCSECSEFELFQCQGGCLGFSDI